jgi:hypothetical protein
VELFACARWAAKRPQRGRVRVSRGQAIGHEPIDFVREMRLDFR